ncbi:UDP-4-amino-4-deoxy-L-arabinose--oxoglutarate aminotransferase [uncultured archaeon]|nr:UDP-4-amino-4-deoxy-L-arabinose--oxoglutarate aminotransferase [uncultured archaeon]
MSRMIWPTIAKKRNTPILNPLRCVFDVLFKRQDYVTELEEAFAKFYRARHALATESGRQAMELAVRSFKLSKGDEIIFPSLTFSELPAIVKGMGQVPVFVNCGEDFNIDVGELKRKITPRTRVIVATHMFGKGCEMEQVVRIARQKKIRVIEDCAHVQGVYRKNRLLGSYGDAAFFSFQNKKPINALGGGMLITNDAGVYDSARRTVSKQADLGLAVISSFVRNYAELALSNGYAYPAQILWWKIRANAKAVPGAHFALDKTKKFSHLQARIALDQLESIEKANGRRLDLARKYAKGLEGLDVALPDMREGENGFYAFVALSNEVSKMRKRLSSEGIETGGGESAVNNCGAIYDPKGDYRKTNSVMRRMIELPMCQQLTDGDIRRICSQIRKALK